MNHLLEFAHRRFEADNGVAIGLPIALKFRGASLPVWVGGETARAFIFGIYVLVLWGSF